MAANSGATPLTQTNDQFWAQKQLRMLRFIAGALNNMEAGGSPKLPAQYNIRNDDSVTITGSTISSISFSVIEGEVTLTINGDAIVYPAGSNVSWYNPGGFTEDFSFVAAAGGNQVLIQTLAV